MTRGRRRAATRRALALGALAVAAAAHLIHPRRTAPAPVVTPPHQTPPTVRRLAVLHEADEALAEHVWERLAEAMRESPDARLFGIATAAPEPAPTGQEVLDSIRLAQDAIDGARTLPAPGPCPVRPFFDPEDPHMWPLGTTESLWDAYARVDVAVPPDMAILAHRWPLTTTADIAAVIRVADA